MKTASPAVVLHRAATLALAGSLLGGCNNMSGMGGEMLKDLPGVAVSIYTLAEAPSNGWGTVAKVAAAAHLISVVNKYARLTAAQKMKVEQVAQQRYDTLVATKKKQIAPRYATKKKAVQSNKALAPEKKQQELAKIDQEWYSDAKKQAKSEYGTGFAVPVSNPEGKPVVAFAKIEGDRAVAASDAYVLAQAPASGSQVAHSGGKYTVLNSTVR